MRVLIYQGIIFAVARTSSVVLLVPLLLVMLLVTIQYGSESL